MKIKIIEVDSGQLTLRECGLLPGDVVDVSGKYNDGTLSIRVIRKTRHVRVGEEIDIYEHEYEVVEE